MISSSEFSEVHFVIKVHFFWYAFFVMIENKALESIKMSVVTKKTGF